MDAELEQLFQAIEQTTDPSTRERVRELRSKVQDELAKLTTSNALIRPVTPSSHSDAPGVPDFKQIFEASPGLYLILDPALRVLAATDAYLEATLTKREEIVGRHVLDVFPDNPDDPAADGVRSIRASFARVLQTRRVDVMAMQRYHVRRPESEGSGFVARYWIPINSPVLNKDASLAYIVHRVENVTDFVLLDQQRREETEQAGTLREQTLRMEAQIYAQSRDVAQASLQLKEANQELTRLYEKTRELDELKSQFFANISHELRTPLTLILGPARKLLTTGGLSAEQRHALEVIERNAGTLLKHVNDLLDLSKMDAGGMEIEYSPADVAQLLRYVISHFESVAGERQIQFTVEAPDELWAEVDAEKLQRILFNLISNAVKFTPTGGRLRLSVQRDKDAVLFAVQDSGPGVPSEMREIIFERFRQADPHQTRSHGGTGLGLAIVKEFVDLHRGSVAVSDGAEGGARFVVKLPLAAPAGTTVKTGSLDLSDSVARSTLADLRTHLVPDSHDSALEGDRPVVLVVEDNLEMNAFVADVLGQSFRVVKAFDGQRGLEKALSFKPDLIVSDLMMPKLSGDELVRAVRRHPELDDIPILLMTARTDDMLRVRLLEAGAQDSVIKPFAAEELVARATSLIVRKRKAEGALRESEARYRHLFNAIDEGFCVVEVIFDQKQKATDYRFLETNPAFEQQTGLSNVVGRTMREIAPGQNEHWFEAYGAIALTGRSARFQNKAEQLDRWFDVYAFRFGESEKRQVAVLFTDITQRKRDEEARGWLAAIVESSDDAVIGKTLSGIITSWNPGAEKTFGYRADEAIGQPALILFPPELTHEEEALLRRIARGERVKHFETVRIRKDGQRIDVSISLSPILDSQGKIIGGSKIARDITGRKQAEARVRESERRFRTMADAISQLAWIAQADGFIIWYNQRWYDYTGTTPDQMEGWGWQSVHHPDVLPKVMTEWTKAIAAGEQFEMEFPLRGADGRFRRFLTRAQPFKNAEGRVEQWFGTNTDVDELKRSEEALRASEAWVHTILSALAEGVVFLNRDGIVELANDAVEHVLGRKLIELSDSALDPRWQLVRGDGTPLPVEEHPAIVTLRTGQRARGFELGVPQADGTTRWLSLNSELVHDAAGVVIGVVVSFFNITAEKQAKEKILLLNAELEQRVIQRTAELEFANRELETFSYSIAHDLRAPLRRIDGYAEALGEALSAQLPEKERGYLEKIRSGADQMNRLIHDLLDFARLSREPLTKTQVDTYRLVRTILEELGSPWPDRVVEIRLTHLPPCFGDPALLKQVWMNLLSNALKYTRKRTRAVIDIGSQHDRIGPVYFVRDNGAGFDMHEASKLFGVFQRLHHVSDFEGTGIGLATVQRIILRHGGRIWAEAAVDRGATFFFTLGT